MSFVHLHVHSQYSLLESTIRAKNLIKAAVEDNMPAVALTDKGNMFGAVEFYLAGKKAGINPIMGLEVFLAPEGRFHKGGKDFIRKHPNTRLVLLAKNLNGYKNLCRISSTGYQEGFYYKPRVDYETLKSFGSDIIALSGGVMGDVAWSFLNQGKDQAIERALNLNSIFKDNFYLEMNKTGVPQWDEINPFLMELSKDKNIPLVAANDVHYMDPKDQLAQEVLICIGSNRTLHDEYRFRLGSDQFYFKDTKQMLELFKDTPEACSNTLKIAESCNVEFKLEDSDGKPIYHLPSYPTKEGRTLQEEMRHTSLEGLEARFLEADKRKEPIADKQKYYDRLDYELSVIEKMGFNGYFLIVQDFIAWAKENHVPVGPGRGSGAGSLVAYSLLITDLDPMPYNLIFERFLNPERVSMPDFDIDFCQEKRGSVIDYVTDKYGQASVSQIITYGKLQARAAIRDVGRVLGMTYADVDVVAKLIPDKLGINLKEALEMEPRMREAMEADPRVNSLLEIAQNVEGLVRHAGIHAAGVIIADGEIVSHAPLYRGNDGENVVQYDMKHSEKIGLIKFDFLGLKTLTHINEAFKLIKLNRDKVVTTQDISLKDSGIYELMSKGDTAGIFQFEGEGITDLIRKAQPDCFEDIVAINALYRPGPMDMIPDYLKRKKGELKVKYAFQELEEITKDTFGIIVYQEQVQLIASKIANYSLGEADILRRAMGKKIAEEMDRQKVRFMAGAKENNHDEKKAGELFDSMAEFAKYGFNKSHAAAYCVIAAQTAYLKNYYPVEFFAALLSTEMNDTDKVVKYVKDAQRHNINVNPPHINYSDYKFSVKGDEIYFSLGAIKGVGQAAVEAILEARAKMPNKKFESLEEFFTNVDLRRVNKKTVECLIKSGGFAGFGFHRSQLMAGFADFIERSESTRHDTEVGQVSLFSLDESIEVNQKVSLPDQEPWKRSTRLAFEKEVLGFYLSDHPLKGLSDVTKIWADKDIKTLKDMNTKSVQSVIGLVSTMREIITKKGTRMAFVQLEDLTGTMELVVFPNAYAEYEVHLKSDKPVMITGQLEADENGAKILVDTIVLVESLLAKAKAINFSLDSAWEPRLNDLKLVLQKYPGSVPVNIDFSIEALSKKVGLKSLEPSTVGISFELMDNIHKEFGDLKFIRLRV